MGRRHHQQEHVDHQHVLVEAVAPLGGAAAVDRAHAFLLERRVEALRLHQAVVAAIRSADAKGFPEPAALDDVRRWPTIADLNMFHKLAHMSPALHSTAHHIVEPMDMKVSHRHLHITYSSMKYSDKTFMGMTTSGKNAEDVMAMCEILLV